MLPLCHKTSTYKRLSRKQLKKGRKRSKNHENMKKITIYDLKTTNYDLGKKR